MKALDEYFLMVVFTLLLNGVHVFANFIFNLNRETTDLTFVSHWSIVPSQTLLLIYRIPHGHYTIHSYDTSQIHLIFTTIASLAVLDCSLWNGCIWNKARITRRPLFPFPSRKLLVITFLHVRNCPSSKHQHKRNLSVVLWPCVLGKRWARYSWIAADKRMCSVFPQWFDRECGCSNSCIWLAEM